MSRRRRRLGGYGVIVSAAVAGIVVLPVMGAGASSPIASSVAAAPAPAVTPDATTSPPQPGRAAPGPRRRASTGRTRHGRRRPPAARHHQAHRPGHHPGVGAHGAPAPITTTTTTGDPPSPPPASMAAPAGYPTLVFDDTFAGTTLDTSKWNTYITSNAAHGWPWNSDGAGGSGVDPGGFDAEYFEPGRVTVDDGLTLSAVRGSSRPGYSWTSGVLSTYGKFQFDGGYVQIEAKMPAGDGMWPGLWMLPGPGGGAGDNFEIDMFEGNYLGNGVSPNDNDSWHLHTPDGVAGGVTDTGADLAAGYHVYGLRWVPGRSITWYVDGAEIGSVTSAEVPVPDEPMELILDLQVADAAGAGWITTDDASTPSPSTMAVAEVQVWR